MADAGQGPPGARMVASAAEVSAAWDRLAAALQPEIDAGPCVLIGVMLGGVVPLVEVSRRLRGDFIIDYCHLSRYGGARQGGAIRWLQPPRVDLAAATVVIIDDIFDEGATLAELRRHCLAAGARAVRTAVLIRKCHPRPVTPPLPDFVGIEVGDDYVFGCGMDLDGRWRHLDAVYAVSA